MIFRGFGLYYCGSISQYKVIHYCPKKSDFVLKIVGFHPLSPHCPHLQNIPSPNPAPRDGHKSHTGNGVLEHPPVGAVASSTNAAMPAVIIDPVEPDVTLFACTWKRCRSEDRVIALAVDKLVSYVLIKNHTLKEINDKESSSGEVQSQDVPCLDLHVDLVARSALVDRWLCKRWPMS
jgi:hypothetical protein